MQLRKGEIEALVEEVKVTEAVAETKKDSKPSETDRFIARRLMVINKMSDKAKAKRLADRILMNRKG